MPAKEPVAPLAIRLRPCSAAAVLRCPIRVPQACPSCRAEPEGQSPVRSAREGLGRPARAVLLARPRSLGSGAAAASGRFAAAGAAPALRAASARTALPRALWLGVWVGASGLAVLPSPLGAPCPGGLGSRHGRHLTNRCSLVRRRGAARGVVSSLAPCPRPRPRRALVVFRAVPVRSELRSAFWLKMWVGTPTVSDLPSPLAAPCSGKPGGRRRRPSLARAARRPLMRRSGVARAAASFSPPLPWPCP